MRLTIANCQLANGAGDGSTVKRWLFNVAAALCLMLCVATVALWLRSYTTGDDWEYQTAGDRLFVVLSLNGNLFLCAVDRRPSPNYPVGFSHSTFPSPKGPWTAGIATPHDAKRLLGIGIIRGGYFRDLVIAYWLLGTGLLITPALWIRRWRRERRAQGVGLCPTCGYDLRATPDRCPECGNTVAREGAATPRAAH